MIAIVIPYYKRTFLKATLDSLSKQTDNRFNVYIGDDNSPENPTELLSEYYNDFNLTYKKFDKNVGKKSLVSQWNRCIDMINNESWVMILGDDDVLGNNVIEEFHKTLADLDEKIKVIRYASIKIDSIGSEISDIYTHPTREMGADFLFRQTRSSLSEYVFKKSSIDSVGFKELPLAWNTDVLAVLEFSEFGEIYTINNSLFYIRKSEESISGMTSNISQKSNANFIFHYHLLKVWRRKFTVTQNKILLQRLLKLYLDDKKNINKLIKFIEIKLKLIIHA